VVAVALALQEDLPEAVGEALLEAMVEEVGVAEVVVVVDLVAVIVAVRFSSTENVLPERATVPEVSYPGSPPTRWITSKLSGAPPVNWMFAVVARSLM
jgi:hypothetical protein